MCSSHAARPTAFDTCASRATLDPSTSTTFAGVVVHSDLRRIGWFECDDERINRLHEAAVWSLRDNICEIPTDCPHRERAGWTGDWQIFAPTAAFLYDVDAFSRKWLADVRLAQRADGLIANHAPSTPAEGFAGPTAALHGSAGWGDVIVLAPWALYEAYGDPTPLAECWEAMERWVGYGARSARGGSGRRPRRRTIGAGAARALPVGHRVPLGRVARTRLRDRRLRRVRRRRQVGGRHGVPAPIVIGRWPQVAEVLGKPDSTVDHYRRLAAGTLDAWQREFLARRRLARRADPGEPCPRPDVRSRARRAASGDRRPPRRARPGCRHDRRDRLPLHGHAAAGARRATVTSTSPTSCSCNPVRPAGCT